MRKSKTAVSAATAQQIWEIDLLGPVRARRGDHTVSEFGTKQATRLLAYLAYQMSGEEGGSHVEILAAMFWPDPKIEREKSVRSAPERQLHSLDAAISKIRRGLMAVPGPAIEVIEKDTRTNALCIVGDAVKTDVQRLIELRAEARKHADEGKQTQQMLNLLDAAALFRGIPFAGFPEAEFVGWRGDLLDDFCSVIQELSAFVPSALSPMSLAPHLKRCFELARYQNIQSAEFFAEPYVTAIQMYQRLPAESQQTRKWCRRLVWDYRSASQLFDEPKETLEGTEAYEGLPPELGEVVREARRSVGKTGVIGTDIPVPDAGSAAGPRDYDESVLPVSGLLPILKSSIHELRPRFFGRSQEKAALKNLIFGHDGVPDGGFTAFRCRVVTITGEGGIGKSKLAEEVAAIFQPLLQDRVGVVRLESVTQSHRILLEIASFLAVSVSPEGDADSVAGAIDERIGSNPLLLVLDNMEHLLGNGLDENGAGETVRLLTILLERCPGLGLLMTSRQLIGVPREQELFLMPLEVPASSSSAGHSVEYSKVESVQLFLDRYLTAGFTWESLESKEQEAVVDICWQVEGVPLSLELLARQRRLKPSQILSFVRQRHYDVLAMNDGQAEDRRQRVFDSIAISFRLLSPQVRVFFVRLAVFGGSFTAESVAAVTGDPLAGELLANLLHRSLILSEQDEGTGNSDTRYRLRDTIRAFAESKLSQQPDERQLAAAAHTRYFKEWASFKGNESREGWQRRIAADYGNIEAALKSGLESGRDGSLEALAIAATIFPFWYVQGRYHEGIQWIEDVLQGDHGLDLELPNETLATLFYGIGVLNATLGNNERAERSLRVAATMYAGLGNLRRSAQTWNSLANVANNRAEYVRSVEYYAKASSMYREIPVDQMREELAVTLCNWGNVSKEMGDLAGAEEKYLESLSEYSRLETHNTGQRFLVEKARVYDGFGNIALARGDAATAIRWYEQAFQNYSAAEPKALLEMATSLHDLGCAYFSLKDLPRSRQYFEEAIKIRRARGEKLLLSTSLHHLAAIDRLQDNADSAADSLDEALKLAGSSDTGAKNTLVYILLELSLFAAWLGYPGVEREIRSVSASAQKEWDIHVEKDHAAEATKEECLSSSLITPRASVALPQVPSFRGDDSATAVTIWGLTVLSLIRPHGSDGSDRAV